MASTRKRSHAAPILVVLLASGVGCSLVLDTDYDNYTGFDGVAGATDGGTGGTAGVSGSGGGAAGVGGVSGHSGQAGQAGDSGVPDAGGGGGDAAPDVEPDAATIAPPPPGEVCTFWDPPSCAGGLTCLGGADCCESRATESSTVLMGEDGATGADPEHAVNVSAACIDTFEVTVGRFRAFVDAYALPDAGDGAHPQVPESGWKASWNTLIAGNASQLRTALDCGKPNQSWTDTPTAGSEDRPMNCVTWYEAFAFCAWDGARLLSEAEFEHVAAGGDENRLYPWGGQSPNDDLANYCNDFSSVSLVCNESAAVPLAVGSAPDGAGRWGHVDIAGNVWEWTLDWFSQAWYKNYCNDCVNVNAPGDSCFFALFEDTRTARGGSYNYGTNSLRSFSRGCNRPSYRDADVGFRCVRDLK